MTRHSNVVFSYLQTLSFKLTIRQHRARILSRCCWVHIWWPQPAAAASQTLFLVTGHTKEDIDRLFSWPKELGDTISATKWTTASRPSLRAGVKSWLCKRCTIFATLTAGCLMPLESNCLAASLQHGMAPLLRTEVTA